ncbi:EamA family transporter [Bacillus thuringiensis serovar roskildiensis]|uniref:EamA family transporter n=3 Tax=Bacillus thuringiensis TaxID=1428 RepID=A0A9Q5SN52_BACTU|nr:DMT family transporter [Bacillus thuringiensis]MEB9661065.1 DMT family transporter [Bacillus cereus]ARV91354.1 transporter [Bacillus thuringiensis]OTW70686.1 EamA family transporter [Bacillus thuringiensis serovar coreanensis]OTX50997.1 EamA family transporter [Bacillus thuringiensis serovar sooncheon]OTX56830.1 EamA family transporter [Bacillus thuringiensis serovar guiyangiensis]
MIQNNFIEKKSLPALKMIVSMVIFGSVGFFSVQTNLPSIELVFVRCIFATIFLSLCWIFTGQYKQDKWERREIIQVLVCGFFLVFNWVFLFKAFENMSVTIAISVYHLAPIIVLAIGSILFKEKLTVLSIVSIIICFLGALLIAGIDKNFSFNSLMSSGMIWGLLAALFYAFTTLSGKGIKNMSAYAMTFLQTLLGIFLLIPFIDFNAFNGLTQSNWMYIIATGFIHTGIVYYLFFDSLRELSTKLISILVFLDPAVAILLDTLLTGFRPTLMQITGITLIFVGMALTFQKSKSKKKNLNAKNDSPAL